MQRQGFSLKQISFLNKSLQWVEHKGQALTDLQFWKKLGKGFLYFHLAGLAFTTSWQQATSLLKMQNEKIPKDKKVFVISSQMINSYEKKLAVLFSSYFGFQTTAHGIHRHFLELPILYHMNKMGYHVKWINQDDYYQVTPETKGMILIGHGAQGMLGGRQISISDQLDFLIKLTCDNKDENSRMHMQEQSLENVVPSEESLFKNDPAFRQGKYQGSINAKRIFSYRDWVLQPTIWLDAIQGFDYISSKSGYVRTFANEVKSTANDLAYFDKSTLDVIKNIHFDDTKWSGMSAEKLKGQLYDLSKNYLEIKKIIKGNNNNSYKEELINLEAKFFDKLNKIIPLVINQLSLGYFNDTTMPSELFNLFPEFKNRFNDLVSKIEIKTDESTLRNAKEFANKHKLPIGNLDVALEPYRLKMKSEMQKRELEQKRDLLVRAQAFKKQVRLAESVYLQHQNDKDSLNYFRLLNNDQYRDHLSPSSFKKYYTQEFIKLIGQKLKRPENSQSLTGVLTDVLIEMERSRKYLDPQLFSMLKDKNIASVYTDLSIEQQKVFDKYSHVFNLGHFREFLSRSYGATQKEIDAWATRIKIFEMLHGTKEINYQNVFDFNRQLNLAELYMPANEFTEFINGLMETDPEKMMHHHYQGLILDNPQRSKLKNRTWPEHWKVHLASAVKPKFKFNQFNDLID